MKPKALVFDFDGLIVDTEVPIFEAWQVDYAEFGQELRLEDYLGCVGSDSAGFDPHLNLEQLTGQTIDGAKMEHARELRIHDAVDMLGPMPGVIALLDEARAAGIRCAVASSSPRSWVERHLNRIELMDRFEFTRTVDDVTAPKPSPELFLAAAEGLGVEPHEAIVFEDSLNGLNASIAAGSPCVIVPNRLTALLDFKGATRRVKTMEEVTISWLREMFATDG
ncbi:UNVERIFIED_CONTAM: hypothetical protein GTU68_046122 [Idotea baltica]|nr:hypothetical protein [Idotea baltica]